MATADEVFDSMCKMAQELIDAMEQDIEKLTEWQFNEYQRKINKIHRCMEEHSKKYRT